MRVRMTVTTSLIAAALVVSLIAVPRPADAAHRGLKGTIAVVRDGDIWTMDADGTHQRQLTFTGRAREPAWSPDGTRIAFWQIEPYEIWVMDRFGQNLARITDPADGTTESSPAWSPDGEWLAFSRQRAGARRIRGGIFLIRSTAPYGDPVRVTYDRNDTAPDWSPDGSTIAFRRRLFSDPGDGYVVALVSPDGSNLREPPGLAGWGHSPAWSPGGETIAYAQSNYDSDYASDSAVNVRLLSPDLASEEPLTDFAKKSYMFARDPEWSPTGRLVAVSLSYWNFETNERWGPDLYVMAANGRRSPVKIADQVTEPAWSPV